MFQVAKMAALVVIVLLVAAGMANGQSTSQPTKPKAYIAVFDFAGGDYGKALADSLRLRLRRHEEYEVIDRLTTQDASGPLAHTADRKKIQTLMNETLAVNVAIYGTVRKDGNKVSATAVCIDRRDPNNPLVWEKTFADDTQRARGEIARKIVEAFTGEAEWVPPQYGDVPEPKNFGRPLNVNGDFEEGWKGWEHPDNVATFIVNGPKGRGKVLRVRTDLSNAPWIKYRHDLRLGLADPNHPPAIPTDDGYATSVGALAGVHYRGDWIKAEPGTRYWMVADVRGRSSGTYAPKVFIKGFYDASADAEGLPERSLAERRLTPETFAALSEAKRKALIAADAKAHPERYRRECYRWYLPCRGASQKWKHFAAPFPPRGGLPEKIGGRKLEWLQVQIYSYWPAGDYFWDNVFVYKDPNQKAPLPEEKARTPNVGKTSDVVDRETATQPEDAP